MPSELRKNKQFRFFFFLSPFRALPPSFLGGRARSFLLPLALEQLGSEAFLPIMQWPASPTRPSRQEDHQRHSSLAAAPPALIAASSPMRTAKTGPLAAARARAEGRHVPDEDLLLVEGTGENSPPPSARKQLAQSVGKLLLSATKKKKATVVAFAPSSSADATTTKAAAATKAATAAAASRQPSALRSFEALLADIDRHLTLGGVSPVEKGTAATTKKKKKKKEEDE